ncbi:MAG: succinylglutamate desuccinylase/aspartoacylase family protein [Candidatus Thorarchaeota archaeon]|jgi:predicted deacylase
MKDITIGSAKSEPGKLTYGFIDGLELPTGTVDKIPVMIAQGKEDGPTFFLTANVHGNELTGVAVIHETVNDDLASKLKGTVVAIPTLNPSGLRLGKRHSEYNEPDPNRLYPEGMFAKKEDESDKDKDYPKPYEQIASKVYSYMEKYADFLIDFHNHSIRSIPYSIVDRVFYKDEANKEEAEQLSEKQLGMIKAFGCFYAADFPPRKYMKLKYHRSVSGAALNSLRIPAFTTELGANSILLPDVIVGSVKGTRNLLRWAGMLDSPMEGTPEFTVPQPDERMRRIEHPRTKSSGIVKFLVNPGDMVDKGQLIAKLTDVYGRPIGDGFIRTDYAGYMIALYSQICFYPDQAICEMGILDEDEMVGVIPET